MVLNSKIFPAVLFFYQDTPQERILAYSSRGSSRS
jgi:hypothetical protein